MTKRKEQPQKFTDHWTFLWSCPTCQDPYALFLVTEGDPERPNGTKKKLPYRVWARCNHCTRLIEVGDEHRELRME